jgi:predicted RNase H-like nuclease (RuvC/YqgF family)
MKTHDTFKIPDSVLLKESRKEVGQLKSKIDYLNQVIVEKDEIIKKLEGKITDRDNRLLTSEEKKAIRQGIMYENMKTQIKSLNEKVRKLNREKEDLQIKIINNVFN